MSGYLCRTCKQYHEGLPLSYGADAPALWYLIPESDRTTRAELSTDVCVIDAQHFFVLGNIEIQVLDTQETFIWSVWVSLSKDNFVRMLKLWETKEREKEPPYFGWLSTQLNCYPDTLNLKTHMHSRSVGQRPYIELERTDHPLAVEQHTGIQSSRVQEIAEIVLHSIGNS